jgi:integrase/recombinase XerD
VARKLAALRTFFYFLWRKGEIAGNPTTGVLTPDVKKAAPRSIDPEDVRLIIESANLRDTPEARRDDAMLRLLYATGMRVSELVGLDVGDLGLDDATVRVVGRGGRVRSLPIDAGTLASLRLYLGMARPTLARDDATPPALFLNHRGQRLTRQGFWLIMKALVKASGLAVEVTPHTLRHSFAAHRLGEGVALGQLQQLLGHASISTTQLYTFAQTPPPADGTPARRPADAPPSRRNGRAGQVLVGASR